MKKKIVGYLCTAVLVFSLGTSPAMASNLPLDEGTETAVENEESILPVIDGDVNAIAPLSVEDAGIATVATNETYHFDFTYTEPNNLAVLSPSGVSAETVVEKAYPIIFANEGGYETVTANDNGAVSIGRLQWHGNRARDLIRLIISESGDVASSRAYLGNALYDEVTAGTSWSSRVLTKDEAVLVSTFLNKMTKSKEVQDKLAQSDIASYVNHGINMGIKNVPALIYFADLENQGGSGRSSEMAKLAVSSNLCSDMKSLTLNELYIASVSHDVMGKKIYLYRRANVYKACAELGYPYCQSWDRMMPCVLNYYTTDTFVGEAWLQWALNAYGGASLTITDQYDAATVSAVRLFQEMNGLDVDGQAGRDTIKTLATMIVNSKTYSADAHVPFLKLLTTKDSWTVAANAESFSLGAKCSVASATLVYTSSNPAVATVSADGVVDPVASGTTTITIQAQGLELSKTVTITVTNAVEGGAAPVVSSSTYKVSGDKISGLTTIPTSAATLAGNLSVANGTVKICDASGNEITGNVGTGSLVQIYDVNGSLNYTYTVIIYGDTNGDGNIWATDYARIKNYIMGNKQLLTGPYSLAADVNGDGNIYATDYTAIKNYIMKGTKINQR